MKVQPDWPRIELADLKANGALGFPAQQAKTLCDSDQLRLQAWCDGKTLAVQAILWNDGDDALGETRDGREIGDRSDLVLDLDFDQTKTPKRDRSYKLNPWPSRPGLRYNILYERGSSYIKGDSTGRGCIRYFTIAGKNRSVRVDTLVIPFAELEIEPGGKIGMAYLGTSTKPELAVNSIGFQPPQKTYYAWHLPYADFHEFPLAACPGNIDLTQIPAGREDEPERVAPKQKPAIGTVPPEFAASDWLNVKTSPTLASFQGEVILVDFWATWCGPCVEGIPHLNELHQKHADDGLRVLGFTDQNRKGIETFLETTEMNYPLAVGSSSSIDYGVASFPTAFIIGRDGKVLWHGNPASQKKEMDAKIAEALEK